MNIAKLFFIKTYVIICQMSPNVLYVECHKILGFDKIKF